MAFLTYADIQTILSADVSNIQANRMLAEIEQQLLQAGLSFNPVTEVRKIPANSDYYQSLFEVPFCHAITSVKLKNYSNLSEIVLVADSDYNISSGPIKALVGTTKTAIVHQIYLIGYEAKMPTYLELSATFGFGDTVPDDLKYAICEFIEKAVNQQALVTSNIANYSSANTGNSSVSIDAANINQQYLSFVDDPSYKSVLNRYLCR